MIVEWAGPALDDLERIRAHLGADNRHARKVIDQVFAAVESLEVTPWIGRPGRRPTTRELVLVAGPHTVAYRVVADAIQVLRVLHTSRRWPRRLS